MVDYYGLDILRVPQNLNILVILFLRLCLRGASNGMSFLGMSISSATKVYIPFPRRY